MKTDNLINKLILAAIFVLITMYGKKAFVWALEEPIYCGNVECRELR